MKSRGNKGGQQQFSRKSKGVAATAAASSTAASALITSSTRKRKPETSASIVPPLRRRLCGRTPEERPKAQNNETTGPSVNEHRVSRSSLLGTLFSPVLHLFKGISGECSTSCTVEASNQGVDKVQLTACSTNTTFATSSGEIAVAVATVQQDVDDFDPYLFIKNLPELSQVVSPCRRLLLPRRTRRCPPVTLVLDLDETLVHSSLEHTEDADFSFPVRFNFEEHTVYVRRRPHLQMFMERVAQLFEIIVFTASQSVYAEQLLNILDPKRKLIRHRIFRDSCVYVEGNYLKDLSVLGRDMSKIVIIDNSPQAFGFQLDNGIPIESWFDDRTDCELPSLLPFLESLAGVDDVRPILAKTYKLRQKIAAIEQPVKSAYS